MTIKEKERNLRVEILNKAKDSEVFKKVLQKFPDAKLLDVFSDKKEEN